ncbi:MAG: phosphate acyltransferase PlsX [Gemmataceae bacterium]
MRIALDAMGGDYAPGPIVAGALQAVQCDNNLRVVLVGDRAQIEKCLQERGSNHERLEIFHCSQVITMGDSPVLALRKKPDSSIVRCWQLMAERKVEAIVSAGNTGAVVAAGLRLRRFLPNVRRPGIAAVMPTLRGPCVMLDVGANVNPKPSHLFQYGVMGSIFAKNILKKERPTIGLMNIGSEEQKGHELARETYALFQNSSLQSQFIGNVEGRDIHKGVADVVVCDGFVGNVVLKVSEGVFEFLMKVAAAEMLPALEQERPKAQEVLQRLLDRYDYSEQGGAPLLGIDGICIICHGASGDRAIKNALGVAARYAALGLNQMIVSELESTPLNGSGED